MSRKMILPKIGVNMTEAMITKWLVGPGDVVNEGDPVLEAETDKSTQEIYADESGIVAELLAEEGQTVECYSDLLVLIDEGEEYVKEEASAEEPASEPEPAGEPEAEPEKETMPAAAPAAAPAAVTCGRVRISPLAKRIAKDTGIDISSLAGLCPGKRIVKKDILAYLESRGSAAAAPAAAEDRTVPMSGIRKVIAARMTESHRDIPTVPLVTTVNASGIIALRDTYKEKGIKVSYDSIMTRIVGAALEKNSYMNVSDAGDSMIERGSVNIGVAVDTDRGLLVPVIRDASSKSLAAINGELADKVSKAKEGKLPAADMNGASMTITNLGMFGVEEFTPIINPPESCILAVGGFKNEITLDDEDNLVSVPTMKLTLVFDHRVVDGAPAARFLQAIAELVETPELLI